MQRALSDGRVVGAVVRTIRRRARDLCARLVRHATWRHMHGVIFPPVASTTPSGPLLCRLSLPHARHRPPQRKPPLNHHFQHIPHGGPRAPLHRAVHPRRRHRHRDAARLDATHVGAERGLDAVGAGLGGRARLQRLQEGLCGLQVGGDGGAGGGGVVGRGWRRAGVGWGVWGVGNGKVGLHAGCVEQGLGGEGARGRAQNVEGGEQGVEEVEREGKVMVDRGLDVMRVEEGA